MRRGKNIAADCGGRLIVGQKKSQDRVGMFNHGQSRMTKLLEETSCVCEVQSNIPFLCTDEALHSKVHEAGASHNL